MKHEINITYDGDTGKLIEVREDGRTVVDREKGGQMMSVPEAMAMDDIIDRLADIEDILGDTYDLDHLRELVKADRDGRIKIIPEYVGKACGSCGHFQRIAGTRRGTCEVKPCATSRRGTPWPDFPFEPSQSRTACKQWIGKGEKNEE